ncbi:family 10 glycosylhydrolase (plasmid) [Kovacikia minuta CCNUW1]|uniref:family 10 glycosylhydrolase n=1 Tax=Kovacikia minuta TaxID=2931930 RepID=UPI001CCCD4C4|nr:family 10 glycosylhydrolase [Kovacikia minuta]UBF30065.1 family 10 glycosylhydrolase [Kovacikia minuta CCNUW1]
MESGQCAASVAAPLRLSQWATLTLRLTRLGCTLVDRLWFTDDAQQMRQAQGKFSEFLSGFDTKDKRLDLLESEQKLFTVFRKAEIPQLQELLQDVSYTNGLLQIGRYYPRTHPIEDQDNFFFDVWKATDAELQTIAASLQYNDIPSPFSVASGNFSANLNGPLQGVNAYWIPSTGTLWDSKQGTDTIDNEDRIAFFGSLLDPRRNPQIKTVYLDVLAPRGALVHKSTWVNDGNLRPENDFITNIVENANFTKQYDDVLSEFKMAVDYLEQKNSNINFDNIHLSAWIEGSAYVMTTEGKTKPGPNNKSRSYENELYQIAKETDGLFGNPGTLSQFDYIDLLNENVFSRLKEFIVDVAKRPGVDDIMLDDHFGLLYDPAGGKDYLTKAITKYTGEEYGDLVRIELGLDHNPSESEVIQWIRNRLTDRMRELKDELSNISGKKVTLSVSVQPFDFIPDSLNKSDRENDSQNRWDEALRINNQDVARWIKDGLITGTVNVQIYRSSFDGFKEAYDKVKNEIAGHLSSKKNEMSQQEFIKYLDSFPKISISVAAKANKMDVTQEILRRQVNYVNGTAGSIFKLPDETDSRVRASVVGFDYSSIEKRMIQTGTGTA